MRTFRNWKQKVKQSIKQFGKRLQIAFTVGFVIMGALIALAKHLANKM